MNFVVFWAAVGYLNGGVHGLAWGAVISAGIATALDFLVAFTK